MSIFLRFRSYKKPESGCKKERIQESTTKVVPSKMKDIKKGNHLCGSLLQKAYFMRLSYSPKYLLSRPANAFPCLASSRAISCTVSWIASRLAAFARLARSTLPAVAPFSASTRI